MSPEPIATAYVRILPDWSEFDRAAGGRRVGPAGVVAAGGVGTAGAAVIGGVAGGIASRAIRRAIPKAAVELATPLRSAVIGTGVGIGTAIGGVIGSELGGTLGGAIGGLTAGLAGGIAGRAMLGMPLLPPRLGLTNLRRIGRRIWGFAGYEAVHPRDRITGRFITQAAAKRGGGLLTTVPGISVYEGIKRGLAWTRGFVAAHPFVPGVAEAALYGLKRAATVHQTATAQTFAFQQRTQGQRFGPFGRFLTPG